MLPLLRAGYIVLCDRYIFTSFARDAVSGCDEAWLRKMYGFARIPDITFFFRLPLEVALGRILEGRPQLKYFEAGMDLGLSPDITESFRIFQGRVLDQYLSMVEEFGFTVLDATLSVHAPADTRAPTHPRTHRPGPLSQEVCPMSPQRSYHIAPPGVDPSKLTGTLIVLEGPDSSGRSTHIGLLRQWLEEQGHAVAQVGLQALEPGGGGAREGQAGEHPEPQDTEPLLCHGLLRPTRKPDRAGPESGIRGPGGPLHLHAHGADIVRGAEPEWVESIYAMALVPDAVFYLMVSLKTLVDSDVSEPRRAGLLGVGHGLRPGARLVQSFLRYQRKIRQEFVKMQKKYGFEVVNANRTIAAVDRDLQGRIQLVLDRTATREVRRERYASASRDADTSRSSQALPRRRTRKAPAV